MFGLGRHHSDPTLAERASGAIGHALVFLHGLPVGVWIAVIGGAAGIVGTILNDRAAGRREAKVAAQAERRATARVKADLLVRLQAHCRRIDAGIASGNFDANGWQAAHDDIVRRARDSDVIDALGPSYVAFMEALHRESVAIDALRASNARPDVGRIVAEYEPFIRAFGARDKKAIARV